ncbi:MAG: hypothetical protein WAU17_02335 [Nitrospirales bacterium]
MLSLVVAPAECSPLTAAGGDPAKWTIQLRGSLAMTFCNNVAAFVWGFSVLFLLLGAVGLTAFFTSKHCLSLTVQSDSRVSIPWRFPFRKEERMVARTHIAPATVVESNDDEGAPYFYARVPIQDGTMLDIAEGHHRAPCEATCIRFNAILGQRSTEATV